MKLKILACALVAMLVAMLVAVSVLYVRERSRHRALRSDADFFCEELTRHVASRRDHPVLGRITIGEALALMGWFNACHPMPAQTRERDAFRRHITGDTEAEAIERARVLDAGPLERRAP